MKRDELEQIWEKVRDGEATAAERRAFDVHMLDDPEMAALWGAETRWLSALKNTELSIAAAGEPTFTQRVLNQFDEERQRRILRRSDWHTIRFAAGWAIAAITLAVLMWVNQPAEEMPGTGSQFASQPSPGQMEPDPMTVLVSDMTEQIQMRPARVFNTVRDTHSMLSVRGAFEFMGMEPPARRDRERD